jgi:hypothetical protein
VVEEDVLAVLAFPARAVGGVRVEAGGVVQGVVRGVVGIDVVRGVVALAVVREDLAAGGARAVQMPL